MRVRKRQDVAKFIERQLETGFMDKPGGMWHYGKYELRQLLDYIYNRPPRHHAELLEPTAKDKKRRSWPRWKGSE